MRSLESALKSWQELKQYEGLQEVRDAVQSHGQSSIVTAGLRSACWKAFLLFDTMDTATWPKTLASSRSAYNALRMHFLKYVDNPDELDLGFDPLSDNAETSPWSVIRRDEELRAEILQDVERCMPENLYFRQPETQRILLDILFIFCKLNPDVSYRQGMHELLAPLLWVIEREAIDLGQSSKAMGEDAIIRSTFDADHIEHDAFALFSQLMQSAKAFYEPTTHDGKENPMVSRSQRIFNDLMPQVDPELAAHLSQIQVVPQVFLMRWIRLLFGREFTFDEMLGLWDVVFAEDPSLEIVDLICVVMLLRIRWNLLDGDCNAAMTLLLRYPELEKDMHAQTFVLDALYLRDHMDREGGSYLVLKYTGRPPHITDRAATPPALRRNITTFSGANAANAASVAKSQSPPRMPRQAGNLEVALQSTARNIYARGEKLGLGKAVRNVVEEVHKRAQEVRDTPTPSPSATWRDRGRYSDSRALSQKVKAFEERNKQLAKLLEGAIDELWDYHRIASGENNEDQTAQTSEVEKLSIAIAKVQFVQVYMADANLQVPRDETGPSKAHATPNDASDRDIKTENTRNILPEAPSMIAESRSTSVPDGESNAQISTSTNHGPGPNSLIPDLVNPSKFDDNTPNLSPTTEHTVESRALQASSEDLPTATRTNAAHGEVMLSDDSLHETHPTRPSLAQSSLSWMLGQQELAAPKHTTHSPSSSDRTKARSFLFGDEDSDGRPSGSGKGVGGRPKPLPADAENETIEFDLGTLRRGKGMQR